MSRIGRVFGKALVGAALALSVALPLAAVAQGRSREVIYNFTGGAEGGVPYAGLIRDAAGNFYGVTTAGGNNICSAGCGAVFKLSPLGVVTVLHGFSGSDGGRPDGKLIADAAGNLYGTTALGGAHGQGVVFKLTPDGTETVLHAFTRFAHRDGFLPYGGVIMDKHGALFGAAAVHGPKFKSGRIFKIAPDGKFSVLYSFTGGADGGGVSGGLIMDKQGNLYGTTSDGGGPCDCGVVFKLAPDGTETVLHTFADSDGAGPESSLIMDKEGALFGTTYNGGIFGKGTVFQLSPDGTLTVLHSFAGNQDLPHDGSLPTASLVLYMNSMA